jgi:hypothetical protein
MTTKEKYEFIKKRYYQYISEDYVIESQKNLFERTLLAILELQACEDEYKINEKEDFSFAHTFNDIDTESLNHFWEIEVNNQKALEVTSSNNFKRKTIYPENDNSSINITPFFEMNEENASNKIIGAKFEIDSQMGYRIVKAEISLEELKRVQNTLNEIIVRIELEKQFYTIIGYGSDYKFEKTLDYLEFPNEVEDRTDELQCNHGLPQNFKVTKVEKDKLGDEKWYVEGFEDEKSKHHKIKIAGYPCNFTFISEMPFEKFNEESNFDKKRQKFLLSKMKELKLPNNGHEYGDFIIKNVEYWNGGETWTLGS